MGNHGLILVGSSRSDGNTRLIVDHVNRTLGFDVTDLAAKEIGRFDYEFRNKGDDFLPLMRNIVDSYETLVFATPVYWYSMSGIMKNFFDRLSDLIKTEKETGRKLRGMNMAMISCGSDENVPDYFEGPFIDSADYLGMNYLGGFHGWVVGEEIPASVRKNADDFCSVLNTV